VALCIKDKFGGVLSNPPIHQIPIFLAVR